MNQRIKQLAEQAGFVFWGAESWNPGDVIDWSSSYDKELERFAQLVVKECALIAGLVEHDGRKGISAQLLDSFEVPV